MITDRLKKDVVFVTIDGGSDGNLKKRAVITDKVAQRYKELGLRVIRFSADENHADILIPNFDEHPYRNTSIVPTMYSYPYFVLRDMHLYLGDYTHSIRFEWDGYPIDFTKWTDDFLNYDLLAEPTTSQSHNGIYLTGGMSLRSRDAAETLREQIDIPYLKQRYKDVRNSNEDIITNDVLTNKKGWKNDDIYTKWWSRTADYSAFGFHNSHPVSFPNSDKVEEIKV